MRIRFAKRTTIIAAIVFAVLILGAWLLNTALTPSAQAEWYDEQWLYRMKLDVDNTKIDEEIKDFPVFRDY